MVSTLARGYGLTMILSAIVASVAGFGLTAWIMMVWIGGAFVTLALHALRQAHATSLGRHGGAASIVVGGNGRLRADTTSLR